MRLGHYFSARDGRKPREYLRQNELFVVLSKPTSFDPFATKFIQLKSEIAFAKIFPTSTCTIVSIGMSRADSKEEEGLFYLSLGTQTK